ncbi:MAG: hypothetical protein V4616_06685 [Bacteroidota bacterium]
MKKTQSSKWKWVAGIAGALFLVLCADIYFSTNDINEGGHTNWQLSRIDFRQPMDTASADKAINAVRSVEGVQQAVFNYESKTLVYATINCKQSSQQIFETVVRSGDFKAERYVLTEEQASGGCPVMSGSEMKRRVFLYFGRLAAKF